MSTPALTHYLKQSDRINTFIEMHVNFVYLVKWKFDADEYTEHIVLVWKADFCCSNKRLRKCSTYSLISRDTLFSWIWH